MEHHWHAFTYTGQARPPDREARDLASATPPLEFALWLQKPRSMMAGTYTNADEALEWLRQQLEESPAQATDLPADMRLTYARRRLIQPYDVIVRYYTASSRYAVRDLVLCPRDGRACPAPPR